MNYTPTAKILDLGDNAFITVCVEGETITLRKNAGEENFNLALDALRNEDWESLYRYMRPIKSYVVNFDGISVDNATGEVLWNGEPIHHVVMDRISTFALNGLDYQPLCKFFTKLMNNPSARAVRELYTFLEHQNLPITDNGNFLAYKGIMSDWYSVTGGKTNILLQGSVREDGRIYNGVGEVIEFPRNEVDDDKDVGCSYGLHAGTYEYASGFARGRMVLVEINPADVISIPTDCSFQKLRTCKYKVVDSFDAPLNEHLYESRFDDDDEEYEEYDKQCDCCLCDCSECDCSDCECSDCNCSHHHWSDCEYQPTDPNFEEDYGNLILDFECSDSAWINSVEWYSVAPEPLPDNSKGTLIIWTSDGRNLVYENFPYSVAVEFQQNVNNGGSAGKFYNTRIRNSFDLK